MLLIQLGILSLGIFGILGIMALGILSCNRFDLIIACISKIIVRVNYSRLFIQLSKEEPP